jgi:hypothetical protein
VTVPYLDRSAPWFVFLANPRHSDDLDRMSGAAFLRRYSSSEAEFRTKVYALAPLILGECLFGFSAVRGELVAVGFLPEEMTGVRAKRAVASGIELAVERGTKVIGLGAQTASATGGGQLLLPYVPAGVTLTNGNAYTAAVVRSNAVEASKRLGLGSRATVAAIGCTGLPIHSVATIRLRSQVRPAAVSHHPDSRGAVSATDGLEVTMHAACGTSGSFGKALDAQRAVRTHGMANQQTCGRIGSPNAIFTPSPPPPASGPPPPAAAARTPRWRCLQHATAARPSASQQGTDGVGERILLWHSRALYALSQWPALMATQN